MLTAMCTTNPAGVASTGPDMQALAQQLIDPSTTGASSSALQPPGIQLGGLLDPTASHSQQPTQMTQDHTQASPFDGYDFVSTKSDATNATNSSATVLQRNIR